MCQCLAKGQINWVSKVFDWSFLSKLCAQEDKEGMERLYGKPSSWYHGIGSLYKTTNEHMCTVVYSSTG